MPHIRAAAISSAAPSLALLRDTLLGFVDALWPEPTCPVDAALTFWLAPSRHSIHVPVTALRAMTEQDVRELRDRNERGQHAYFGLGLRRLGLTGRQQGKRTDVIALPGFALDIDIYDPVAHAADNLPRSEEQAYQIIEHAPDPTMIVHTGYGWHCYWLFPEPVYLRGAADLTRMRRLYKGFQQPFIDRAAEYGWHVDETATVQRVWRVPGFINQKRKDKFAIVQVRHLDVGRRYPLSSLPVASAASVSVSDPAPPPQWTGEEQSAGPVEAQGNLEAVAEGLRRLAPDNANKPLIDAMLEGRSFADPGARDVALQRLCSTISWTPAARRVPPMQLAELLRPSLSLWAAESDAALSLDEEIVKAIEKLGRAQQDWRDHDVGQRKQLAALERALTRSKKSPEDPEPTAESIARHAIIQRQSNYYVYHFGSEDPLISPGYSHPLVEKEVLTFARDAWETSPLELTYVTQKDETKSKTVTTLLSEYATVAVKVAGDMTVPTSYFDTSERTFYQAMAKLRVQQPEFNAQIDQWLRLMCGGDIEEVLDWIATLTLLSRQNCALFLAGCPGAGKGLLASGLSRLWREGGPSKLDNVIGDYNADMFECPLIFLDEGLPKSKNSDVSIKLRALIGAQTFIWTQKYLVTMTVKGAVRLLIAANNDDALRMGDEIMGQDDLNATAARFMHVTAQPEGEEWLVDYNRDNQLTNQWVEGDGLARYALWLRDTRSIQQGRRFLVEGTETRMHQKLLMQGNVPQLVYEWIVRYTTDPGLLARVYQGKRQKPLAEIGQGRLWLNTQAVLDGWDIYIAKDFRRPAATQISDVLKKVSKGQVSFSNGDSRVMHNIRFDLVLGWAQDHQLGNGGIMRMNFQADKDPDPVKVVSS